MRYAIWRFHTVGSFWATLAVPNLRLPFFVCLFKHFLGSPKGAYRDTSRKVKLCESPGKAGGLPKGIHYYFGNKTIEYLCCSGMKLGKLGG
jgi:hypothetical protein